MKGISRLLQAPVLLTMILLPVLSGEAVAARVSDIKNTKHNLSVSVPILAAEQSARSIFATTESEVCIFCHTPHGSEAISGVLGGLWNRKASTQTYAIYGSSSMDASLSQPGGSSKLCLSCHDGTLAIGAVNVLNGAYTDRDPFTEDIAMTGAGIGGVMPDGPGSSTGFTRNIGIDLTNDHPISFTYDSALATTDGELRDPLVETFIGGRNEIPRPSLPLEQDPASPGQFTQMQCGTCHDPHLRDESLVVSSKFLRLNRFQSGVPIVGLFNEVNDIMCLSCHNKDVGNKGWAMSAHANPDVAGDLGVPVGLEEYYTAAAAATREFPNNLPVWQAACLNCHDTHTVQGATRMLREGTDSIFSPKQGGNSAIEETCYQCHSSDGATLVGQGQLDFEVPDIKTSFTTMIRHMPIASLDQPAGIEVHDIGTGIELQSGKDFLEDPVNLGKGDLTKRHVECTDCHHPHRVTKNRLFWSDPSIPDDAGTHNHSAAQLTLAGESWHTNIASGVLRGTSGVEPIYGAGTAFMSDPTSFILKRGDPGTSIDTNVNAPHLTREYQVCLKCHSNYAFDIPPQLGVSLGGTPFGTNSMQDYTNSAMEFQSPLGHQGELTAASPTGAAPAFLANNHRSWHPVMDVTGRTTVITGASASSWLTPFDLGVGQQSMYCSDCHGASTASATVVPNGGVNGQPWGPHGSNDNFILKGPWSDLTRGDTLGGLPGTSNDLCFKCHDYNSYGTAVLAGSPIPGGASGFRMQTAPPTPLIDFTDQNIHSGHLQTVQNYRCTYCHVAVPHGWKNKALLVNLNDVGPEAGLAAGTQVRNLVPDRYYQTPYYNGAVLKITTFAASGQWQPSNCGSVGAPGNGLSGVAWMTSVSEGCQNLP